MRRICWCNTRFGLQGLLSAAVRLKSNVLLSSYFEALVSSYKPLQQHSRHGSFGVRHFHTVLFFCFFFCSVVGFPRVYFSKKQQEEAKYCHLMQLLTVDMTGPEANVDNPNNKS